MKNIDVEKILNIVSSTYSDLKEGIKYVLHPKET